MRDRDAFRCGVHISASPPAQQIKHFVHSHSSDSAFSCGVHTCTFYKGQEALYCNGADECLHADTRTEARGLLRLCTQQIAEKQVETAEMHSTSNKAEQHCYQWQARLSFIERDLLRSNDAGDGA
eukprot:1159622-Pelagomonas_calceolata.AAC.5